MKLALVTTALCAATGLAQAQSATYAVDPTHSFVNYEVRHFGTSTSRGRFDKKEGSITIDRAAKTGKVDITIETASISSGVGPLDSHLKGKDFFNAAEFPTARFTGDRFTFDATNKVTAVAGSLTLAGKTQPVTLVASQFNCYENPMLKREVCGGDFEATIQRSLFGSTYGLPAIPDNVRLLIQVEAVRQ